jgi:hypothetical protein
VASVGQQLGQVVSNRQAGEEVLALLAAQAAASWSSHNTSFSVRGAESVTCIGQEF